MSGKVKTQAKAPARPALAPPAFQVRPFAAQNELAFGEEHDASSLFGSYLQRRAAGFAADFGRARPQMVIQPKLTLGAVGDRYEQEADQVAQQVVSQINRPTSRTLAQGDSVQNAMTPFCAVRRFETQTTNQSIRRNKDDEEESGSKPGLDIPGIRGNKWEPYYGKESEPGKMEGWKLEPDQGPANQTVSFYHTTTSAERIDNNPIIITEGRKEFGPGFYTTAANNLDSAKLIGERWFTQKQEKNDWTVIRFEIPGELFKYLGVKDKSQRDFLKYMLGNSEGYPNGGQSPNDQDIALINQINRQGKVLIFPDDKDQRVAYEKDQEKSWTEYTNNKMGGGEYMLVIGPQQPDYMGNKRQYAWTYGRGLWLINSAKRYTSYKNS